MTAPSRGPDKPNPRRRLRAAWMLTGALALFLGGMWAWRMALEREVPPEAAPVRPRAEPVPDGGAGPGPPVPVPFEREECVPWNVSAREAAPASGLAYLLLQSRLADPYALSLEGFSQECARSSALTVEDLKPGQLQEAIGRDRPAAIVAIGMAAAALARAEAADVPLLYAQVAAPARSGLDDGRAVGVIPWIPGGALARRLDQALPRSLDPVAILHPPGQGARVAAFTRAGFEAAGRKVLVAEIRDRASLGAGLAAVEGAKAWVLIVDREVIDAPLFNAVQVAAEARRLPLAVSDEDHVRAGAYAGVGVDTERIGRQLCRLAGALSRGSLPSKSRVFCPEFSFAVLNVAMIEKLGHVIEPSVLSQAKVYKWH